MALHEHEHLKPTVKNVADWIAAALGIGTVAGLVNILVGVLSACWLGYQLYVAITYELPIKRERLRAVRAGRRDPDPTDQSPLS